MVGNVPVLELVVEGKSCATVELAQEGNDDRGVIQLRLRRKPQASTHATQALAENIRREEPAAGSDKNTVIRGQEERKATERKSLMPWESQSNAS